jgi:alkyl sulfatase BDS1-like metallo-beta-lactamase superfamily hydrolase
MSTDAPKPRDPSQPPPTAARQAAVYDDLDFSDAADFEDARRGFIGTVPDARVENAKGNVVWSMAPWAFLEQSEAPTTVNPSRGGLRD